MATVIAQLGKISEYTIRKEENSGMMVLSKPEWSHEIAFGGVPAIRQYAAENSDVPQRIIHKLLAKDAGFEHCLKERFGYRIQNEDDTGGVFAQTEDDVWRAAADVAISMYDFEPDQSGIGT